MPTTKDVRAAMNAGNADEARRLLKSVLDADQRNSEAWYLAAQLSNSTETKIKHLQRALLFDPDNVVARKLLRQLGGKEDSPLGALGSMIDSAADRAASVRAPRPGSLRELWQAVPAAARLVLILFILLVPLCFVINTAVNFALQPTATPEPQGMIATARPFQLWTPALLAEHFDASPLDITIDSVSSERSENSPLVAGRVVMIHNPTGADVQIMFYDSIGAALDDRERLEELGWTWGVNNENAVLIYKNLNDDTFVSFVQVFDSAIMPEQVQANFANATATSAAATLAAQATPEASAAMTAEASAAATAELTAAVVSGAP